MSDFFLKKRLEYKLTQNEFAKSCKIDQSYWSRIENFKVVPRIEVLCEISKKLNIPPCHLVKLYICNQCMFKENCDQKFKL